LSQYINDKHNITTDATCYESEVRYPTDQKLLWESVHWNYHQMKMIYKWLKINFQGQNLLNGRNDILTIAKHEEKHIRIVENLPDHYYGN